MTEAPPKEELVTVTIDGLEISVAASYQNERRVIDKELTTPQESPKTPTPTPKH